MAPPLISNHILNAKPWRLLGELGNQLKPYGLRKAPKYYVCIYMYLYIM